MPIFEYQCEACETIFERLILHSQSAQQMLCPQCGSQRTAKIFSTFSTTASSSGVPSASTANPAFT
jgi:putative FmdB family regulatory protein